MQQKSHRIMQMALAIIAETGKNWGTSGDGHASCIQIARNALNQAEEADINDQYAREADAIEAFDAIKEKQQ